MYFINETLLHKCNRLQVRDKRCVHQNRQIFLGQAGQKDFLLLSLCNIKNSITARKKSQYDKSIYFCKKILDRAKAVEYTLVKIDKK